jgi:hypothetical protein
MRRTLMGLLFGAAAACLTAGNVLAQTAPIEGLKPASPQPTAAQLAPGLAVEYITAWVRHVDELEIAGKGRPGEPLEMLDWNTLDGLVLTSEQDDGIGARITGFINFPEAGTYVMATQSNDGVRLKISDQVVIEDPDVHRDKFSENVRVVITEPGWYPFYMLYFERKGTSTLELYWQPPGADGFDFVPAEAFAHMK